MECSLPRRSNLVQRVMIMCIITGMLYWKIWHFEEECNYGYMYHKYTYGLEYLVIELAWKAANSCYNKKNKLNSWIIPRKTRRMHKDRDEWSHRNECENKKQPNWHLTVLPLTSAVKYLMVVSAFFMCFFSISLMCMYWNRCGHYLFGKVNKFTNHLCFFSMIFFLLRGIFEWEYMCLFNRMMSIGRAINDSS